MSDKILGKTGVGAAVTARGGEHDACLVDVSEHRHVILAATKARLIDRGTLNRRELLGSEHSLDVMMHQPPQPGATPRRRLGVVLASCHERDFVQPGLAQLPSSLIEH